MTEISKRHAERLKRFRRNDPELCDMYERLPVWTPEMVVRCPTCNMDGTPCDPDDIRGCGSSHVGWDGDVYDCYDCGIFFSDYAANPPHQRIDPDPEEITAIHEELDRYADG